MFVTTLVPLLPCRGPTCHGWHKGKQKQAPPAVAAKAPLPVRKVVLAHRSAGVTTSWKGLPATWLLARLSSTR
jgi:hypothetical protein